MGTQVPSGERAARALQLTALAERLAQVMEPTYIPLWFLKPIVRLDDQRPVDAIANWDDRSVSRLLASLEDLPVS